MLTLREREERLRHPQENTPEGIHDRIKCQHKKKHTKQNKLKETNRKLAKFN